MAEAGISNSVLAQFGPEDGRLEGGWEGGPEGGRPQRTKLSQYPNFRFHDLRHSCAGYLAMSGATPTDIAAVLGHKTLAMVKRYAHLSDQHVSQVVARMKEAIFRTGLTSNAGTERWHVPARV